MIKLGINMLEHAELKAKHRAVRESFPTSLSLRTHRALSWLNRAEQENEDEDVRIEEHGKVLGNTIDGCGENRSNDCGKLRDRIDWMD